MLKCRAQWATRGPLNWPEIGRFFLRRVIVEAGAGGLCHQEVSPQMCHLEADLLKNYTP